MKNLYTYTGIALACLGIVLTTSCEADSAYEDEQPSIAGIAVANADFSTLEAAAVLGEVAVTLSNSNGNDPSGDFTVFAPTDDAFARLGLKETTLGVLQQPFLKNTLLYHVSDGNLVNAGFEAGGSAPSLLGPPRRFINRDGAMYINGSEILATDISASNGTVHVIDKVMIASGADVVQTAIALNDGNVFKNPELTFLVAAVVYADLAGALSNTDASFTVFAPNDAAFKAVLAAVLGDDYTGTTDDIAKLDTALGAGTVQAILLNHVFADVNAGQFTSELNAGTYDALGSDDITLGAFTDGVLTVSGSGNTAPANMVIPDVQTTNGIVHVIDQVLLPVL
ncbi:fasciclin domain-containing protein [Leeuwenhoekiella marinoflava]|uniref:Uncaracterized surface protein containing fasciclin (FAS1) repeats n=2 Tax=Leeuwenhoekiella marinoflava TaxID=988 RepID=A0ABY1HW25_9FLAO|nr:fasciclin domain-containing protein [Leeuwenhoekiella marinoflava]RXG27389.1 putative surface protein with fasciclin (FAS1) repeats [Leeuwenhoekiella marinoflava]SHF70484.1 Uncaracterized surface protein containing fasciclin (FAS1) repeats [Leeuwenhoekiella marinoflava DSM 3653]